MNVSLGCGSATCDPKQVVTNLFQERGRISETIWERIAGANSFLAALAKTKQPFPAGNGEVLNRRILNIPRAKETDVLNWSRVGGATPGNPGYNPCCIEYKDIPYGDRFVSACMYQDGWKFPDFCIVDLVFKHEWEMVLQQWTESMSQWTDDVWGHWSVVAFQRSVQCATLNSQYAFPEQLGVYPNYAPTSAITFQHCEEFYRRLKGAGASLSSAVPGFELVFIGDDEFAFLEEKYLKDASGLGNRGTIMLPELGAVERIGKYLFVKMESPRRFRDRQAGESWEDCIVPCTIDVPAVHGTRTVRNPDYYNAAVARYTEIIFFNMAAVNWLTPPVPLSGGLNGFMAPQSYAGDFILFNEKTDCDPMAKNGRFYADFMSGMIANFPERARCVMALAVHNRAKDTCPDSCVGNAPNEPEKWWVLDCAKILGENRVQLLIKKGTLPAECPDNHSLFAVDKGGNQFIIDTVVAQEAYTGDSIHTEGGTIVQIEFPSSLSAVANCRSECDGWDYVACLPSDTPSSDPTQAGCQGCSPNTVSSDCTFTAEFDSVDGPVKLMNSAGATLVTFSDPDDAATVESDIQTWLDANGGGEATVTVDEFHYVIVVTGAAGAGKTALTGAEVEYDGGLGYPETAVVQTGDCD